MWGVVLVEPAGLNGAFQGLPLLCAEGQLGLSYGTTKLVCNIWKCFAAFNTHVVYFDQLAGNLRQITQPRLAIRKKLNNWVLFEVEY